MTTFNLFNAIAWIVAGIISAAVSILFLMKNPRKRLNQYFSMGFILWSLSLIFNGINFTVAYSSLFVANLFRDFCVVCGILSALTLFLGTIGIYYGAERINWLSTAILTCLGIILSAIACLNDWVTEDGLGGFKTTDNWLGKILGQIIPAIFVIAGLVFLTINYFTLKNKAAKRRIGFFTIGFLTIIIGLLMFVFDAIVDVSPYIFLTMAISSWVAGPFLMLVGFYVKTTDSTPKVQPEILVPVESSSLDPKLERPS